MAGKVIIFGKAGSPYTTSARSAYGDSAEYYDVHADPPKLQEMLQYSNGVRKVPVIVKGDDVIIGHGGT